MPIVKLLKFYTPTCAPCKALAFILDKVKETEKDVIFEDIDVSELMEEANKFNVRTVPTLIILKDGVEQERLVGIVGGSRIQACLRNALNS